MLIAVAKWGINNKYIILCNSCLVIVHLPPLLPSSAIQRPRETLIEPFVERFRTREFLYAAKKLGLRGPTFSRVVRSEMGERAARKKLLQRPASASGN